MRRRQCSRKAPFTIHHSPFTILLAAALFTLNSSLFTSCSSDDLIEEETVLLASDPESIELVFTITMDHSYTATRATRATRANSADNDTTWKDTQNRVDAETAEDAIQSMQVILFTQQTDESNNTYYTFLTTVAQMELTSSTDTDNNTTTFTYTGVIPTGTILTGEAFNARIVILANCSIDVSSFNGNTKYTDTEIGEALYTMTKSNNQISISSTGIPMWGTTTGSWTFTKGEKTDIGSLALLRAMAKIKVSLDDDMINNGYRIVTASLQGFSDNKGYIHPTGYGTVDKTEDLTVGDSTFHAYTSSTDTQDSLTFFTYADSSYAYIYVPEYETPSSDAASINVHIYRYGDDGKDYCNKVELQLREYINGKVTSSSDSLIDLVRNHILSYTLSRTATSTVTITTNDYEWYYSASDISWDAEEDNLYVLFVAHDEYYHTTDSTVTTKLGTWKSITENSKWTYADTVYADTTSGYTIYYNLTGAKCKETIYDEDGTANKISQNDYGDADAVWCLVTYPRWKDDDHDAIKNGVSTAHYLFYVTPLSTTGRRTWKAYLTNTDAFTFAQGAADWKYTHNKTSYANTTQYYASTGVARDYPYMIAVEPNPTYYWTTLQIGYMKKYHPNVVMRDKNGVNRGDTTYADYSWTTTGDSIYDTANFTTSTWSDEWYNDYDWSQIVTSTCTMTTYDSSTNTSTEEEVDTLLAVYTDLFILLDGTTATTALPINRSSDDNGQFVNWFAGGTHEHTVTITDDEGVSSTITLDQEQWMRIWRTNAVTTSGENDYANILTNINKASDLNERWYNK